MSPKKSILIVCLCWPTLLFAEQATAPEIVVVSSFARASIPGTSMAAAFLKLNNKSRDEHLLSRVSSILANNVELHGHIEEGGMMRMRRMAHIHLPPSVTKILKPGGLHIMLIGLKENLKEGQVLPLTLVFEDGSEQNILVPVKSRTANYP